VLALSLFLVAANPPPTAAPTAAITPTNTPVDSPPPAPPLPAAPALPDDAAAIAAVFTGIVAVNVPPGTEAETDNPKELPAVALNDPLEANPAAFVVTIALSPPPANEAPPIACGSKNATAIPATGTSFSSVTRITASELTLPFLARLPVVAPSTIVSLNLLSWAAASGPVSKLKHKQLARICRLSNHRIASTSTACEKSAVLNYIAA